MLGRTWGTSSALACVVLSVFPPSPSRACTIGVNLAYDIDAPGASDDSEAPEAAQVESLKYRKGVQGGRTTPVSIDTCATLSIINIEMAPISDNVTRADDIGYEIEYSGDAMPSAMSRGSRVVEAPTGKIVILWTPEDYDEVNDFSIRLTSVDRAGNRGGSDEVHISDGFGFGCNAVDAGARRRGRQTTPIGALLLVVAVALVAFRRSAGRAAGFGGAKSI